MRRCLLSVTAALKLSQARHASNRIGLGGFQDGLEGHLEAASGFEPLNKGFAVLGIWVTKSYQKLTAAIA